MLFRFPQPGMSSLPRYAILLLSLAGLLPFASTPRAAAEEPDLDFVSQIRPILATRCFNCHGPDEGSRVAALRLDEREGALAGGESGDPALVPGDPDASELIARIRSHEDGYRMPPSELGPRLSEEEIAILERWVLAGGDFRSHWSFNPLERPVVPASASTWPDSSLDAFILQRLETLTLSPAERGDRRTLARRLAVDLNGLPPDAIDFQEWTTSDRPDAAARYVDRLLASPTFGERWAVVWLDLARYADSQGYAQDSPRNIWRYRDWVIDAINADMAFDQFTLEQLAGDLLPNATEEQQIATAFHRNTMTNSEGGTDDEEFRSAAIVDRVNTTMQVWMGLTMSCAQCHSHKYDPISQEEYFRFYDVFNQTEDRDHPEELPVLAIESEDLRKQRSTLSSEIERLRAIVAEQRLADVNTLPPLDAATEIQPRVVRVELRAENAFLSLAEVQLWSGETNVAIGTTASQSSTDYEGAAARAIDGNTDGHYVNAASTTHTAQETNPWWEVDLGQSKAIERVTIWNRTDTPEVGQRLKPFRVILLDEQRHPLWVGTFDSAPAPSTDIALPKTAGERDEATLAAVQTWWAETGNGATPEAMALAVAEKRLAELKPDVVTPVLRELPLESRRTTFVQLRGNFRAKGDQVQAGLPESFASWFEVENPNRRDVAQWLTDPRNPLTSRVIVNRYWEQLFGTGIVETAEDFGTQGAWPSHPELLDHLAIEFIEHDWDVKWLLREMVLSSTYLQSSATTPDKLRLDPQNVWLSRGPRFRAPAETIRDQALASAGLLSHKMHGPPVRPPRPNLGLNSAFGGSTDWETSPGEDRFRRGLYTTWRRTTPYPSMTTFDATSREVCTIRRIRTNTPLQALVTLNDPVYIEAAQGLARRVLLEAEPSIDAQLDRLMELALFRQPTEEERQILKETEARTRSQLAADTAGTEALATRPLGPLPANIAPLDAAVWTVLANVILNLDESLSRP